jgi:hypothetical protein
MNLTYSSLLSARVGQSIENQIDYFLSLESSVTTARARHLISDLLTAGGG